MLLDRSELCGIRFTGKLSLNWIEINVHRFTDLLLNLMLVWTVITHWRVEFLQSLFFFV